VNAEGQRDLGLAPGEVEEPTTRRSPPLEVSERRRIDHHDVVEPGRHVPRALERRPVGEHHSAAGIEHAVDARLRRLIGQASRGNRNPPAAKARRLRRTLHQLAPA